MCMYSITDTKNSQFSTAVPFVSYCRYNMVQNSLIAACRSPLGPILWKTEIIIHLFCRSPSIPPLWLCLLEPPQSCLWGPPASPLLGSWELLHLLFHY